MLRIGIDLGGTKIEAVALDAEGREHFRQRVPTPQGDYMGTVMTVGALVEHIEAGLGERCRVGIGTPGAESVADGRIFNANSTCLNGQPLRRDLQSVLQREIRLANDANCFALSEAVDGAGQGAASVFGVILGTGVGGGIVINGQLLEGASRIAGEWGHNPLPHGEDEKYAPVCYCGRKGCVETWLSGPGLANDHCRLSGETLTPPEIVRRASAGDPACLASLEGYESRLARALAVVINILDPEVIVLGGGLSNMPRLYDEVPRRWLADVFSSRIVTRLLPNRHGDASGVRGAARLWQAGE